MSLETFKFGMLLTIIPFSVIFLFITVWWALVDLSLRELSRSRRISWALTVIILPLAGVIAYNYLLRRSTPLKGVSVTALPADLCSAVD